MTTDKLIKLLEDKQEKYKEYRQYCDDNKCRFKFSGAIGACSDIIDDLKKHRRKK